MDFEPYSTRIGGLDGLFGFSAELSNVYSFAMVVPAGKEIGSLSRYSSCQLKSQLGIWMSDTSRPPGRKAVARRSFPR